MKLRSYMINILTRLIPYRAQVFIRDAACRVLGKMHPNGFYISYMGKTLWLPPGDLAAAQIRFFDMLHGSWNHERYEQAIVRGLLERFPHHTLVLDLGASYGMYTWLASDVATVSHIVAVEAMPSTYDVLARNIAANDLSDKVTALHAAVADMSGKAYVIREVDGNSEWSKARPADGTTDAVTINSISVDDLLARYADAGVPIFIKMDIEGGEPSAFEGMQRMLRSQRPWAVMLEFHVGLLGYENACEFAEGLLSVSGGHLYIMDAGQKELRQVDSLDTFLPVIAQAAQAKFPGNVFNLLLTNQLIY